MSNNYQMSLGGALKASFQSSLDGTLKYKIDDGKPSTPQSPEFHFVKKGYQAFKPIGPGLLLTITGIALVILGAITAPSGLGVALLIGGVVLLVLSSYKFKTVFDRLEELRKLYLQNPTVLNAQIPWLKSEGCVTEK